jgi:SAM-dependent methyltransferase
MNAIELPQHYFERQDRSDDELFYAFPRKVVHIDETAIAVLTTLYEDLLSDGGTFLDLMSSWRSHYPINKVDRQVIGLGMNADEMADNPQLNGHRVQNLNREPRLPYEDNSFDGSTCAVSVQYLTRPIEVFTEVYRVLKPGGIFVVSFSNRCFPTKAVAVWAASSDEQHIALVGEYFRQSAAWAALKALSSTDSPDYPRYADPLFVVWARKPYSHSET